MIINESSIQQLSSHQSIETHQKRESLRYWRTGEEAVEITSENPGQNINHLDIEKTQQNTAVSLSAEALTARSSKAVAELKVPKEYEAVTDLNLQILKEMIERLTGRKINFINHPSSTNSVDSVPNQPPQNVERGDEPGNETEPGFGIVYDYYESHYEYEKTSFSAQGVVTTGDGKEISIAIDMNMSREFYSEESFSFRAGEALKDPLVLNFSGTAAQLTERNFSFDIDADGKLDQISFVGPESGFLVHDQNNDGVVNDGSELFGPLTGNGFSELSEHDDDKNGWIDENDAIYDKLRIWMEGDDGKKLIALGEKGVGAIYLGHVDTPFLMKDADNALTGAVKSTSVFLNESGSVGTIQQIDLVA